MNQERTDVLKRIQNDEITAEEGAKLLEALDNPTAVEVPKKKERNLSKMFRIKVLSSDGDKVNVQIPLAFAKIALKKGNGLINLAGNSNLDIDFDMVLEMIEEGNIGKIVDIESADGDIVEIMID